MSRPNDPKALSPNVQKYVNIFAMLLGPLVIIFIFVLLNSAENDDLKRTQQRDTKIMKNECAQNCAYYGLTEDHLIGPKLKQNWSSPSRSGSGEADTIFVWHSEHPQVTLQIEEYEPPHVNSIQISCKWITPNLPNIRTTGITTNDEAIYTTVHEYKFTELDSSDLSCE